MKLTLEHFKASQPQDYKLFCLVTGIRGAGKSTIIGTLNVSTLLITSTMESHSIEAAKLFGHDNIIPVLYDVDDDNKQLKPDKSIEKLHNILDYLLVKEDLLSEIQCVALDSFSAVDKTFLETSQILLEKNNWNRVDIQEQEHFKIIRKLKELHRKGLHIVATLPICAVFDDEGLYASATPEIRGQKTTSGIAGIFSEVLVIGKYQGQYIFQMDLMIKKDSKTSSGEKTSVAFKPRITGLSEEDLKLVAGDHLLLAADLNYVYELKKRKRG